jgi:hypothetical protein
MIEIVPALDKQIMTPFKNNTRQYIPTSDMKIQCYISEWIIVDNMERSGYLQNTLDNYLDWCIGSLDLYQIRFISVE